MATLVADMASADTDREWWKEAVVYQIYPRSFNDSDGDGVGDLRGIIEKLDYLDALGVDVVWLNPIYESPNVDNGYDIADYRSVMDEYGSMDDWENLLEGLHERDIRLIMDLVVNHTSDEHEWFQRSRAGEEPYDDYYIWKEGDPEDGPPNNWESGFGGSAWSYDDEREAWYLHLFDERQPDLNWENPAVRDDVFEMMEWWLEKGIDGFRMDVINLLSKPDEFPDGYPEGNWVGAEHFADGPRIHEYLGEMYDRVLSNYDVMTVGECIATSVDEASRYTLPDGDGLSMVFHFDHITLDYSDEDGWYTVTEISLPELKEVFTRWQRGLERRGWNSLYLGNHDWPRMVSRFGNDEEYRVESATLLATLLHTLQGTPYLFQGDEIGMTNYPFESMDEIRDADAQNRVELMFEEGEADSFEDVRDLVRYRCRDNARTPMQWSDEEHAGFTEGDPWITVNPNYERINVEAARADEDSIWHYYRRLIEMREDHDVMVYGDYDLLLPDHEELWAYTRTYEDEQWLVVLNFSDSETEFELPADARVTPGEDTDLLLVNYPNADTDPAATSLRPWEARVYSTDN
jgi:glycosidase